MEAGINTHTMRNRLFIILLLSVLTATGSIVKAQKVKPQKDQNVIIAWSPAGKYVNYSNAVRAVLSEGYGIKYADSTIGVVSTLPKGTGGSSTIRLNISVNDTSIVFRGQMISSLSVEIYGVSSGESTYDVVNKGQKGSSFYLSWQAMDKIARAVSDSIIYLKR